MPRLLTLIIMLTMMNTVLSHPAVGQTTTGPITAPSVEPLEIPLWQDGPPGDQARPNQEKKSDKGVITCTWRPDIYVYLPPADKATGDAVIVCPGGGFNCLEFQREGAKMAEYLNSLGLAGIVLKYRLRSWDEPQNIPTALADPQRLSYIERALADAQRAIRTVRANAEAWHINPHRIGIGGFSAGGLLSAFAGVKGDAGHTESADPVERCSSRPDFLVLIYPVFGKLTQEVTPQTPPAFLVHASDDPLAIATESTRFYDALHKNNVRAELHIFPSGGHGFDLGRPSDATGQWLPLLKTWLMSRAYEHVNTRPAK